MPPAEGAARGRWCETGLVDGALPKRHAGGGHRLCPPEETLARVAPLLPALGISRVATITGLDRVGVPVALAVRPASRALAVSQGKGLSLAAARVSAIMESIETHHAERVDRPLRLASARELATGDVPPAAVERLPRSTERVFSPDARLLWVEAREVLGGGSRWVPHECVHTDFRWPRLDGSGFFLASTNGLASGNHPLEAFAHALYELVERDALALAAQAPDDIAIDPATVEEPRCRALLERLDTAGLDVLIRDRRSDVGVACFEALVAGRDGTDVDPEFGSGCHPDRGVALLRALTEAVQGRTTFITGSRDDYGDAPYTDTARRARLAHCRELLGRARRVGRFDRVPDLARRRLDEELDEVIERLVAIGVDEVLWVDLTRPGIGVPVVRVLVPGLEGPCRADDYLPGERARRHAAAAAGPR